MFFLPIRIQFLIHNLGFVIELYNLLLISLFWIVCTMTLSSLVEFGNLQVLCMYVYNILFFWLNYLSFLSACKRFFST